MEPEAGPCASLPACDGPCALCLAAPARYTCPRCQAPYCGLSCYQGPRHRRCSEAFYRGEVLGALRGHRGAPGDIQGVLKRAREAERREGESPEGEDEEADLDTPREEEGGLDPPDDAQGLWEHLTPVEQRDFLRLLESEGLGALLSPWQPWWERHEGPCLVQELGQQGGEVSPGCTMQVITGGVEGQTQRGKVPAVKDVNGEPVLGVSEEHRGLEGAPALRNVILGGSEVHQPQAGDPTLREINVGPMVGLPGPQTDQEEAPTQRLIGGRQPIGGPEDQKEHERPVMASKQRNSEGLEASSKQKATKYLETNEGLKMGKRQDETSASSKTRATRETETETLLEAATEQQNTRALDGQSYPGRVEAMPPTKQRNVDCIEDQKLKSREIAPQSRTENISGGADLLYHGQITDFQKASDEEISGGIFNANHAFLVPPVPKAPPPLSSLTRNHSPLVQFNLVNALYGYAFGLKLYNGDLSEDFLLQEFCDNVLAVSGALNSTRVFGSTAEALQAGIQAVLARGSHGDPQGAAMAVAHILIGGSSVTRKDYTLAALSHLTELLGKARKLVPKEDRQRIFTAKKKCEFLLSWANEHEDTLTLLSVEVQKEYRNYMASLKEVELITSELEKSWGGKKPPEKKVLIQELD